VPAKVELMKRIAPRVLIIIGASGAVTAAVETAANAGIALNNHTEPTARDHR
jgi:hypothetical protein